MDRVKKLRFMTGAEARAVVNVKQPDKTAYPLTGATITAVLLGPNDEAISTVTPVVDTATGSDWANGKMVVVFGAAETALAAWVDAAGLGNYLQIKWVLGGSPTIIETANLIEIKVGHL